MQIALCDDEKNCHDIIKELISQYKHNNPNRSFSMSSFSSGAELLNHVDEYGGFDLYILDIIMPEMNGIELGIALRERNDFGMVIYLTTSPDFALESYRVEALNYLLKPVDAELFFQCLDRAYNFFSKMIQEVFSIKTPDRRRIVPVADICYAERTGKQVSYHLTDSSCFRSATFNGSFQNAITDLLAHKGIILVGSSFAVNLFHVKEVTRSDMILTGNMHVPIPRRMYETIKEEWANFWLNGGRYYAF